MKKKIFSHKQWQNALIKNYGGMKKIKQRLAGYVAPELEPKSISGTKFICKIPKKFIGATLFRSGFSLYLCHPKYPVHELVYLKNGKQRFRPVKFSYGLPYPKIPS